MHLKGICENRLVISGVRILQVCIDRVMLASTFRSFFWTPLALLSFSICISHMIVLNDIPKVLMETQSSWLIFVHFLNRIRNVHKVCILSIFKVPGLLILLRLQNLGSWFPIELLTFLWALISQFRVICRPCKLASCLLLIPLILLLRFDTKPFLL